MNKKIVTLSLAALLVLATGTLLYAHFSQRVLKTDMGDPEQVVLARKGFMMAVKGNMIDMNKKLKAGNLADLSVNGDNIAVLATALPVLYKETYKAVYPVKGSKTFYKGATAVAFEAASEKMRSAGEAIRMAAEKKDKAGIEAGLESLKASCGGCHSAFRGKY